MEKAVALVAGASSGLGRAVARALAADGHTVYAGARSFAKGVEPPQGCKALTLDVTSDESTSAAIQTILGEQGRLDVLVCCAATFTMAPLEELSNETLANMMNVNVLGMARCIQAVLPQMRAQGRATLCSSLHSMACSRFPSKAHTVLQSMQSKPTRKRSVRKRMDSASASPLSSRVTAAVVHSAIAPSRSMLIHLMPKHSPTVRKRSTMTKATACRPSVSVLP